jgi:pimeloyl-ACP methyl ester carboxylesterase
MYQDHSLRLADGRRITCLELGDPEGRPVFYCHGYPGSRLEARLVEKAAENLGLRVLAPDRPGMGGSDFQPGRTLGAWAGDVAELADWFGQARFAVVGVSGGGPYALACAARIPERLSGVALISGLGLISSRDDLSGMIATNRLMLRLAMRFPAVARLAVRGIVSLIRRDSEFYFTRMIAGIPAADRKVLADPGYRQLLIESTAEALRQGGRGAAWELTLLARPWDFRLEEIPVPVRIWQGLADNIVPAPMARRLAAALPDRACHYLQEEGHFSLVYHHHSAILADLHR